jgi:hypothetical protein
LAELADTDTGCQLKTDTLMTTLLAHNTLDRLGWSLSNTTNFIVQ